jgi:siroheme synthase (precorrin-2 oxidase/ferrochelatase)
LESNGDKTAIKRKEDVMSKPGPVTQAKRNRERSKQERKQEKLEKRSLRKELKKERDQQVSDGVDPDIAMIRPGPQPIIY